MKFVLFFSLISLNGLSAYSLYAQPDSPDGDEPQAKRMRREEYQPIDEETLSRLFSRASAAGDVSRIQHFLAQGADASGGSGVNPEDSPVFLAASFKHTEAVDLLIASGASKLHALMGAIAARDMNQILRVLSHSSISDSEIVTLTEKVLVLADDKFIDSFLSDMLPRLTDAGIIPALDHLLLAAMRLHSSQAELVTRAILRQRFKPSQNTLIKALALFLYRDLSKFDCMEMPSGQILSVNGISEPDSFKEMPTYFKVLFRLISSIKDTQGIANLILPHERRKDSIIQALTYMLDQAVQNLKPFAAAWFLGSLERLPIGFFKLESNYQWVLSSDDPPITLLFTIKKWVTFKDHVGGSKDANDFTYAWIDKILVRSLSFVTRWYMFGKPLHYSPEAQKLFISMIDRKITERYARLYPNKVLRADHIKLAILTQDPMILKLVLAIGIHYQYAKNFFDEALEFAGLSPSTYWAVSTIEEAFREQQRIRGLRLIPWLDSRIGVGDTFRSDEYDKVMDAAILRKDTQMIGILTQLYVKQIRRLVNAAIQEGCTADHSSIPIELGTLVQQYL